MTITKGDARQFKVAVTDADNNPLNLSSYTMKFTAKDSIVSTDLEANITSEAVVSDPASGIGVFNLIPSDTKIVAKDYYFDVQISDGADRVYTVIEKSVLTITDEVTIDA